ncbi:MAG: hypothetical protein V1721_08185 [Pseudomonadota bacterium]
MKDTASEIRHIKEDPFAAMVDAVDRTFLLLYRYVRRHWPRITRLIVALLPLMVLLVGSCKTSQLPWAYGGDAGSEQFRTALFPDRVNFQGAHYYPAAGYVSRARIFVESAPEVLMMMTQQEIGYLFGKPTMHRRDADAEVLQYKTGSCVVDFYFYNEHGTREPTQLSYVDLRLKEEMIQDGPPRTEPPSVSEQSECLRGVVAAREFPGAPA